MSSSYSPSGRGGAPSTSGASSVLSRIAIPKRATASDLIQTVIANDVATRSAQGVTSGSTMRRHHRGGASGGGTALSSASVVAKIPSNRVFWTFVRRSIAANPVASQEPPLFLLSDTITKDALTVNQHFFQSLVAKYEEVGPPADLVAGSGGGAPNDAADGPYATSHLRAGSLGQTQGSEGGANGSFATLNETSPGLPPGGGGGSRLQFPSFLGFSGLGSFVANNASMRQGAASGGGRLSPHFAPQSFADANNMSRRSDDMQFSFAAAGAQRNSIPNNQVSNTSPSQAPLRMSNNSMPSGLFLLPPSAAGTVAAPPSTKPMASLLTVTVSTSGGQLRTFKASQPFWDHVVLLYHEMTQAQMKAENGGQNVVDKKQASRVVGIDRGVVEDEDGFALLRQAQQDDDDRIVLTVTASAYDAHRTLRAQKKWLKQVRSRATGGYGGVSDTSKDGRTGSAGGGLNASMLSGQAGNDGGSPFDDDDDDEVAPVTSIQLLMAEWRAIVEAWDAATALSLETKKQPPQHHRRDSGEEPPRGQRTVGFVMNDDGTTHANSDSRLNARHQETVEDEHDDERGVRSRGFGVVDPQTTSDVVQEALTRMREMERRSSSNGSGSGQYWMHFMNHWKVLEAQYRNYL